MDDEWEKVELELQLQNLTIKKNDIDKSMSQQHTTATLPLPSTLIQNNEAFSSFESTQEMLRLGIPHPVPEASFDEPIETVLLEAVTNPRERMFVLAIEHQILEFMKSTEISMSFPLGYNSFRRLVVYKITNRFHLSHMSETSSSNETDRGVIVAKNPEVSIPRSLLINVPFESNHSQSPSITRNISGESLKREDSSGSVNSNSSEKKNQQSKKVIFMKRESNRSGETTGKKESASKISTQVVSEKEKQYNEAKARIFGDLPEESNENANTLPSRKDYNGTSDTKSQSQQMQDIVSSQQRLQQKALERDRNLDVMDPDFVRQPTYPASSYNQYDAAMHAPYFDPHTQVYYNNGTLPPNTNPYFSHPFVGSYSSPYNYDYAPAYTSEIIPTRNSDTVSPNSQSKGNSGSAVFNPSEFPPLS